MSDARHYTPLDRLLMELDHALRTVAPGHASTPSRPYPAASLAQDALSAEQRELAGCLMRVNHAGEIAAQALYQGQAVMARDTAVREAMSRSAAEETDHLAWCEQRLQELDTRTSRLDPFWYLGSFAIGALAGLAGDRVSLGFIAETENQVVEHLDRHLARLPEADARSRAVVEQMKQDEAHHGAKALEAGGITLPAPVAALMRLCSMVMTTTSYWI